MTVAKLITRMGGAAALAKALGLPGNDIGPKRVRAWALRGSIPAEYWAQLAAYSKERELGVTLEVLAAAHAVARAEAA